MNNSEGKILSNAKFAILIVFFVLLAVLIEQIDRRPRQGTRLPAAGMVAFPSKTSNPGRAALSDKGSAEATGPFSR